MFWWAELQNLSLVRITLHFRVRRAPELCLAGSILKIWRKDLKVQRWGNFPIPRVQMFLHVYACLEGDEETTRFVPTALVQR